MRYFRIFLLHMQEVVEQRGRVFVWLLIAFFTPAILILFWRGAKEIGGWTIPEITSYYLFIIVMNAMLMSHQEEHIARIDIQEGQLTGYLVRPFSYFWLTFFRELPWRLLQGGLGISALFVLWIFLPNWFTITTSPLILVGTVLICILAFFLTFLFKSIIGILAFWMTDTRGLFEMTNVMLVVFTGSLMPLAFYPQWLMHLIHYTPFSYMLYFPVISLQGKVPFTEMTQGMLMQVVWIAAGIFVYRALWRAGLQKYTTVGQ